MTPPLTERPGSPKNYTFVLWSVFLTALASVPAYYRMFTGFSSWDDQGALMVTVKQYLGGMKLYNQISVPYGPVYYFYNHALRTLSGTPLTHDVVRMSSLIPWLLTAFVCAWIGFRFTGSLILSSATHLLVFLTLSSFFQNEPGHPQELCILLLVCLVAAGIIASIPRRRIYHDGASKRVRFTGTNHRIGMECASVLRLATCRRVMCIPPCTMGLP